MKKTNLLTLLMCVLSLCSCSQSLEEKIKALEKEKDAFNKKVATIKNDSLRQSAKEFGSMLFWLKEIDLQNQEAPKDTAYQENPFLVIDDYPSMDILSKSYLNSIIVETNNDVISKRELKIHFPFELPFQQKINWSNVGFSNTNVVPVKEEAEENVDALQVVKTNWNGVPAMDIYYPERIDISSVRPVNLSGHIEALIPRKVLQFKFSAGESGGTKTQDGISVRLKKMNGHVVSVEVTNPHKNDPALNANETPLVKIMAMDETKQYLYQNGSFTGPEDLMDYYDKILNKIIAKPENVKVLEKEVEAEEKKFEEKHKNKGYYTTYYKGTVTDVVVYVLDYSKATKVSQDLNLRAYTFGNLSNTPIAEIPIPVTVYDPAIASLLNQKPELKESELKLVGIKQQAYEKKTEAPAYEEPAKFSFEYPKTLSSLFINDFGRYGELKSLSFFDAKGGKKIELPKDSLDLDNEYFEGPGKPWVEYQVNRIEYNPSKFPVTPKFVTGNIEMRLADVKKSSYTTAQLPQGITIAGNKLIINRSQINDDSRFYVKDKTGKYLKELTTIYHSNGSGFDLSKTDVHYFYGIPQTIERYEPGEGKMVNHTFELELLPYQPTP